MNDSEKKIKKLEDEIENFRDAQKNWGYDLLSKLDASAAESTDLCSYVILLQIKLEAAEKKIEQVKDTINDDDLCNTIAKQCHDTCHDDRWCPTCSSRGDGIDAYQQELQEELGIKK